MGVRRLFYRGGQNFPGGQIHTIWLKNTIKILFFSKKTKKKHTVLLSQGVGRAKASLALACGRPWLLVNICRAIWKNMVN